MLKNLKYFFILLFFFCSCSLFSQVQDSLLKQINNIDVSLNSPPDSNEDLYLNTVSLQSFYDILSPMGEWIQVSKDEIDGDLKDGKGQGYSSLYNGEDLLFIWRPTGMETDWRPYTNGRWEYTNHGWLWVSYESWGSATYHYGRWWNSPARGWVWLPGYVWAPAWVRWRITDEHIGWVPLTPAASWNIERGITEESYTYRNRDADWVFIEKSKFADDINSSSIVSTSRNSSLVSQSKNVTNIKIENDRIVNNGPEVQDIENKTGRKIIKKDVKFSRDGVKSRVGSNDVTVFKGNFRKYDVNKSTGKPNVTDKPKKFKESKTALKNQQEKKKKEKKKVQKKSMPKKPRKPRFRK
jgi:hypothetical protein